MESEENYGDCGRPVDWPIFPEEPRGVAGVGDATIFGA